MKKRILSLVMAGVMGLVMLISNGCCHMHHRCDKPSCCDKKPCCDRPADCQKSSAEKKPCDKAGKDCPLAEQKK